MIFLVKLNFEPIVLLNFEYFSQGSSTTARAVTSAQTVATTTTTQRSVVEPVATVRQIPIKQIQYTYQYNTEPRPYQHIYRIQVIIHK